jgi:hypothetical protein
VQTDLSAGTHVHVTPARGRFSLDQLKNIAFTLLLNEEVIRMTLTRERRGSRFCKINSRASSLLRPVRTVARLKALIRGRRNAEELCSLMQGNDRNVLWNFQNTRPHGSGTIEFRGGRHMRGPRRALRLIAFAVSVIYMSLQRVRKYPCAKSRQRPFC